MFFTEFQVSVSKSNETSVAAKKTRLDCTQQTEVQLEPALKAALDLVDKLQNQVKSLEAVNIKLKKALKTSRKEHLQLKNQLSQYFGKDQIKALCSRKVRQWSKRTVKKALLLRIKRGSSILNNVRKNFAPLPTSRTLNNRIKNLPFKHGILQFNIKVLAAIVENFTMTQRHFGLIFDEKSLTPGLDPDRSEKNDIVGYVTLPPSHQLANHVLAFLLVGIEIRVKIVFLFYWKLHRRFVTQRISMPDYSVY